MEQGVVFKSNRSQAIRLPKSVALPDDLKRVDVVAVGRVRIITPAGESWESWFDGRASVPISCRGEISPPIRSVGCIDAQVRARRQHLHLRG